MQEKQLKNHYKVIFKNQKEDIHEAIEERNGVIQIYYEVENSSNNIKQIRHIKTIIELIKIYRKDFPSGWENYANYMNEDKGKKREIEAFKLLKNGNLCSLEEVIKSWWGRTIKIHTTNVNEIFDFLSFDDYMKKFIQQCLNFNNKYNENEYKNIGYIKNIIIKSGISEYEWNVYIKKLAKKYKININDSFDLDREFVSLLYPYYMK